MHIHLYIYIYFHYTYTHHLKGFKVFGMLPKQHCQTERQQEKCKKNKHLFQGLCINIYMDLHILIQAYIQININRYKHTQTHIKHTYMHTIIYAFIYTYIHIYQSWIQCGLPKKYLDTSLHILTKKCTYFNTCLHTYIMAVQNSQIWKWKQNI